MEDQQHVEHQNETMVLDKIQDDMVEEQNETGSSGPRLTFANGRTFISE